MNIDHHAMLRSRQCLWAGGQGSFCCRLVWASAATECGLGVHRRLVRLLGLSMADFGHCQVLLQRCGTDTGEAQEIGSVTHFHLLLSLCLLLLLGTASWMYVVALRERLLNRARSWMTAVTRKNDRRAV